MPRAVSATASLVLRAAAAPALVLAGLATAPVAAAGGARTATGGWKVVASSFSFTRVACPKSSVCVAIGTGDRVARTSDGGLHWTAPALPVAIVGALDLSCGSVSACVVTVDAGKLGAAPQPPRFLVTADAGLHWSLVAPPKAVTGLGSVSCATPSACVALATTASQRGLVLSSLDGGRHWSTVSSFAQPGFPAIRCVSATTCFRASGGYGPSGPIPEVVAVTFDGGRTFSRTATLRGAEQVNALSCPSANVCAVGGSTFTQGVPSPGEGAAYATSNGGRSWTRARLPDALTGLTGVSCVDNTQCFASATASSSEKLSSGYGVLLASSDGGAHWTIAAEGRKIPSAALACSPQGHCVAAGSYLLATR